MLGTPHVLQPGPFGGEGALDIAHDANVLGVGVGVPLEAGHEQLSEDAELHRFRFS